MFLLTLNVVCHKIVIIADIVCTFSIMVKIYYCTQNINNYLERKLKYYQLFS